MSFAFKFERTAGEATVDEIREVVKAAARTLSKKLKELGETEVQVTIEYKQ